MPWELRLPNEICILDHKSINSTVIRTWRRILRTKVSEYIIKKFIYSKAIIKFIKFRVEFYIKFN